jgi:hypothetical protein
MPSEAYPAAGHDAWIAASDRGGGGSLPGDGVPVDAGVEEHPEAVVVEVPEPVPDPYPLQR